MTSILALWLGLSTVPNVDLGGTELTAMVDSPAPALVSVYHALELPALHGLGALVETVARGWLALPRSPSAQLSGFGIWIDLLTFEIDTAPAPTVGEAAGEWSGAGQGV